MTKLVPRYTLDDGALYGPTDDGVVTDADATKLEAVVEAAEAVYAMLDETCVHGSEAVALGAALAALAAKPTVTEEEKVPDAALVREAEAYANRWADRNTSLWSGKVEGFLAAARKYARGKP